MTQNIPIHVVHVKQGYEDRRESIERQMSALGLSFNWVLDFDIPEITETDRRRYNVADTLNAPNVSCTLKHIQAWQRIATSKEAGGIVFEDDVLLRTDRFVSVLNCALDEYFTNRLEPGCIYLGNASALHTPWTALKRGQYLYPAEHVRAADSYWLPCAIAKRRLDWLETNTLGLPADHLMNKIDHQQGSKFYWLEPTIVSQASQTGQMSSSIQKEKSSKASAINRVHWWIRVLRRRWIWPLLGRDFRKIPDKYRAFLMQDASVD